MSGSPGPRLPLILRPCLAPAQPRPCAPSARCLLSNCLFSVLFLLPSPREATAALFSPLCQPEAVNAPQTGKLTSVSLFVLPVSLLSLRGL